MYWTTSDQRAFGRWLVALRVKQGYDGDQAGFAKILHYTGQHLCKLERGSGQPSPDLFLTLEWDLGVPYRTLLRWAKLMFSPAIMARWEIHRARLIRVRNEGW